MQAVAIVGSRSFDDYEYMKDCLDKHTIEEVVSGGCKYGADKLAERYAEEKDLTLTILPADWEMFGKSAGFKRNVDIVRRSDYVIAFWDGKSKGTKHTIEIARKQNKRVIIYYF